MSNSEMDDARSWRLAQAQTMIDLFTAACGRAPSSKGELAHFLDQAYAAGHISDGPITPTNEALVKVAKYGRLV